MNAATVAAIVAVTYRSAAGVAEDRAKQLDEKQMWSEAAHAHAIADALLEASNLATETKFK